MILYISTFPYLEILGAVALGNPFTYKEASLFYALADLDSWEETKEEILIKVHESHSLRSFNGSALQLSQMRRVKNIFKDLQSLYKQLAVRENIKVNSASNFPTH